MSGYINQSGIPLSLAVFLATDNYDHDPTTISATALIKPLRQLVLTPRVPPTQAVTDIVTLVKSRIGSAIHDSIEQAWVGNHATAMAGLGFKDKIIGRVKINPDPKTLEPGDIPVYLEQRTIKEIDGYKVSGKFDFVAEGRVEDFKSTSVNTWMMGAKKDDYQLQGSIYRWLNPEIITEDHMAIQFIFTDWMPGRASMDPKYPNRPVEELRIPLLSISETESFIRNKLAQVKAYENKSDPEIPLCTDKELWRRDPVFKYYKNPKKLNRSTKNFTNRNEAYTRLAQDGGAGTVIEVPGEVVACKYCPAHPICEQKDALIASGDLKL